eukprot:5515082-Ditylum_brightwellii.AAC.1
MEQVDAWLDCPWKVIAHSWTKTETVMNKGNTANGAHTDLIKQQHIIRGSHSNVGIGGSLDMHQPGRGSGVPISLLCPGPATRLSPPGPTY